DLAASLNNLAIYLASNGQQREALQTAQEAVTIRRNLAKHNPAAHTPNLATSLNTYANILERSGNTKEAARIRQVRDEVLKRMKDLEEGGV
ncbi:tetratricopeptide repeat protein, partial [Actinomyces stomatis]|uniref:tetratricopeptide repeat protein n=1 Tax=Actinomyces stomatis TaxID=3050227 RepID=UPI0028525E33